MRLFDHFPDTSKCPVCGKNDDKPCFLLPIDGTQKGMNVQALPTHAACITERLDDLRYNSAVGIVYMHVDREGK